MLCSTMSEDALKTCREFVDLLEQGDIGDCDSAELRLVVLLDKLAFQRSIAKPVFDDRAPDPPDIEYEKRRKLAERTFPKFGFYNTVDEIEDNISGTKILVGDAIDDIADIYGDLKDVLWVAETGFEKEAIYDFVESYKIHWGMHLRELQLYLHRHLNGT